MDNDAISRSAAIDIIDEERRFIESLRETAFDNEDRAHNTGELGCAIRLARKIKELPALDVAPVVHAYWIEETFTTYIPVEYNEDGDIILHQCLTNKCSVCGRYEHDKEPYCNCGARMDGEENG
jgi:hypothetical protein